MSEWLYCYEEELVENLEDLLDDFFNELVESGLKITTAEKHTTNAALFLIQYHVVYFLEGISSIRAEKIYDFLGLWYFQCINNPNPTDINAIITSLKKLFTFLYQRGKLSREQLNELKDVCKDKKYFQSRYHEFMEGKMGEFIDDNDEDVLWDDWVKAVSHQNPLPLDEGQHMENLVEEMSFKELIQLLNHQFQPQHREDNIIQLQPFLDQQKGKKTSSPKPKRRQEYSKKALLDYTIAVHRSNLVFLRWLDRFNCSPTDLPPDPCCTFVLCDSLLTCFIDTLDELNLSTEECKQGHELIDLIDRILWDTRHEITTKIGLDLRLLAL